MAKVTLRRAEHEDAESIARIQVAAWQKEYRGIFPDEHLDSLSVKNRTERHFKKLMNPRPKSQTLIAEIDSEIVGFCIAEPPKEEKYTENVGVLQSIYIHPEHLRKGIGSMLMKESLNFLKSHRFETAVLWVVKGNEKAKRFYEKAGWNADSISKEGERGNTNVVLERYSINL